MKKIIEENKKMLRAFVLIFLFGVGMLLLNLKDSYAEIGNIVINENGDSNVVYLSDIPYQKAEIAWGTIGLDKTNDNAALSMLIDGSVVNVKKGIWAHATSTVEYDISNYKDYAYLSTYYGLNTTNGNKGNGVKFYIYTSKDGVDWTLRTEENPVALKSGNNAIYVKIDIKDANYIRLYANDNGSNGSDHAVWADAKLVKEGYSSAVMPTVAEYDEKIKAMYQPGEVQDDLKLILLQREFIKNVGQYQLRSFLDKDSKHIETLNWFLNNEEALRLWTIGGKPSGTYEKSLEVLSNLYHTYKEDLSNENITASGTKYKDLYLKMMLSLSLSHAANVGLWVGGNQFSDAVVRYDIYKQMHLNNELESNSMFESYTIDEMRYVMGTNIDDEEIKWLRDFSFKKFPDRSKRFSVQNNYFRYTTSYSYHRPQYYSAANYDKWNAKYNLADYNITYQVGKPKLWIVFEEGAVCGGISKTSANLYGVWGYPARVVGQPGHAAYIYLYNAGGGKNAWQLSYNVATTAWANTGGSALNGWGTRYATNSGGIQSGSYILLGQEAQNEYEKYEKAQLILLQADTYKNDLKKLEQIYSDALNEEKINLDAWIGLTDVYLKDETKTAEDLYHLAEDIANTYTYHPLPMYDSTRRLAAKMKTSPAYYSKLMTLQGETLNKATKATGANTIYSKEVPVIANALLGVVDSRIATFSFDGANAGKIVLSKQLQSAQTNWSYSLDGGTNWVDIVESFAELSKEELESITPENDIKIHISGLPKTPENIYTIDIKQGTFPASKVTIDDFENRFNGTNNKMEWTLDPVNGEWQAFSDATPLFKGDVVVYVRMIATGIYTTTKPVHYTFTTNASSLTNRFIPRNKISVAGVSPNGKYNINNIIDGNVNSAWFSMESTMGGSLPTAYVTLKLDEPRYVSELDYIPYANAQSSLKNSTGRAKVLKVEVSKDNVNWVVAFSTTNVTYDKNLLAKMTFDEPELAQYIRITCTAVQGSGLKNFFSVAVLNLYENPTVSEIPLAEVSYDIAKKTNKDVVAELVNENREITVTNNDGKKTHTFTENGEFTFEFVDENGKKGSATAKVDWIDKTPPKADVQFSTTEITNEDVVATITFDKENITILSDIELTENPDDQSKTFTFSRNDSIELEFKDELGNIGKKMITVDWIDIEAPTAEFEFNTTNLTDKEVVATLKPSEEVTILNNNGQETYTFTKNGSFTFEFIDKAGNAGTATVNVYWISKLPQYSIQYSTKELTKEDVSIVLDLESGYQIFNNNASKEYIFTESGTFEFQYKDANGNVGIIPVTVDWIDKTAPTAELKFEKFENKVVVRVVNPSEEITFKDGNGVYEFTENGSYEIIFYDKVGNEGKLLAIINTISDKEDNKPENPDEGNNPGDNKPENPDEGNNPGDNKPENPADGNNPGDNKPENPDDGNNPGDNKPENPDDGNNPGDNKPVNPENPNKPITPVDPETPNPPVNPDDANNSEDNQPNSNNGNKPNDNKPLSPNNGNNSSNNNLVNPDDNSQDDNETKNPDDDVSSNDNTNYHKYTIENIKVELPKSVFLDNGTLQMKSFDLSSDFEQEVGSDYDSYDISILDSNNSKVPILSEEVIKITLPLKSGKEILNVYEMDENGKLKPVDYKVNNGNVVLSTHGLGKFVVSYKEELEENNDKNIQKNNVLPFVIAGVLVTIGIVGIFVYKFRKRKI